MTCFKGRRRVHITVTKVYDDAMRLFEKHNIPEAEESARYLLSDVLQLDYRLSVFHDSKGKVVSYQQLQHFQSHCERRLAREPIQYIIGNWDFFGFTVKCTAPVLIPRPETEELVDLVLSSGVLNNPTKLQSNRKQRILDIGCGSGVIGIALLSKLADTSCVGIDLDPSAVELTRENVRSVLCTQCPSRDSSESEWKCCRYDSKLSDMDGFCSDTDNYNKFDIIVSNPPYIPSGDLERLSDEVRCHESSLALDGGPSGLDLVEVILRSSSSLLSADGARELWMEVSHTHPDMIQTLLEEDEELGRHYEFIEGIKDGYGQPRFVRLRAKKLQP